MGSAAGVPACPGAQRPPSPRRPPAPGRAPDAWPHSRRSSRAVAAGVRGAAAGGRPRRWRLCGRRRPGRARGRGGVGARACGVGWAGAWGPQSHSVRKAKQQKTATEPAKRHACSGTESAGTDGATGRAGMAAWTVWQSPERHKLHQETQMIAGILVLSSE